MARIVDNEHLKASRTAAEINFTLVQASMNLQYLEERDRGAFEQCFASIYHDLSVTLKNACLLNSRIMKIYEDNQPKP